MPPDGIRSVSPLSPLCSVLAMGNPVASKRGKAKGEVEGENLHFEGENLHLGFGARTTSP